MNKLQEPVPVADDEAGIRDLTEMTLMEAGLRVDTAADVEETKGRLSNNDYSLVLTDMRIPDGSDLEVVQYTNELMPNTSVAMITAFGNVDQAVEALRAGAFDYLQKPTMSSRPCSLVKSAVLVSDNTNEPTPSKKVKFQPASVSAALYEPKPQPAKPVVTPPKSVQSEFNRSLTVPEGLNPLKERFSTGNINPALQEEPILKGNNDIPRLLGTSPQMAEARHPIRKLARNPVLVYISGEFGTGKGQTARTVHELSDHIDKPFITVNCGAIPENLMGGEFLDYEKGSLAGTGQDRLGFFQHADDGTLFFGEVADLSSIMQVKLLRATQEKVVRRIGDIWETPVDVRTICTAHKNLEALVESSALRQDLYYRLNAVSLHMPLLRKMREDSGALILYLLYKHHHGNQTYRLSLKAQEALLHYSYPGNFRELGNILKRAVVPTVGQVIQAGDLQTQNVPQAKADHSSLSFDDITEPGVRETMLNHSPIPPFDPCTMQIQDYLDQVERSVIKQALQQARYNRTQAAKLLDISFHPVHYRMERSDIN